MRCLPATRYVVCAARQVVLDFTTHIHTHTAIQKSIKEARIWLRRFGGNLYTCLPYAVSAKGALDARKHTFEARWKTMQR